MSDSVMIENKPPPCLNDARSDDLPCAAPQAVAGAYMASPVSA